MIDLELLALHARLPLTRRRWDAATALVEQWLALCAQPYVAWSGGKDSTVIAALVHDLKPGTPIIRRTHGIDMPGIPEYCAQIAAEHGWNYHVIQVADRLNDPDWAQAWETTEGIDRLRKAHGKDNMQQVILDRLGIETDGLAWGLRADENDQRNVMLATYGPIHTRRDGVTTCAPIWKWSTPEVFAWLHDRSIPWSPVYDRLAELGANERSLRVGNAIGVHGLQHGRGHWLRLGWPDTWRQLVAHAPALEQWT